MYRASSPRPTSAQLQLSSHCKLRRQALYVEVTLLLALFCHRIQIQALAHLQMRWNSLDGIRTVAVYSVSGMPSCSLSMSISFSSKSLMRSWFSLSNMNVIVSPWSSACTQAAGEASHASGCFLAFFLCARRLPGRASAWGCCGCAGKFKLRHRAGQAPPLSIYKGRASTKATPS